MAVPLFVEWRLVEWPAQTGARKAQLLCSIERKTQHTHLMRFLSKKNHQTRASTRVAKNADPAKAFAGLGLNRCNRLPGRQLDDPQLAERKIGRGIVALDGD